jgi:hypothetical protein
MKRTSVGSLSVLFGTALMFTSIGRIGAQMQPEPAQPAQPILTADASHPAIELPQLDRLPEDQPAEALEEVSAAAPSQSVVVLAYAAKSKKPEYTGPTTLVELPPTPMLDEEGMQRQDPDGKLMFNPPVKQQRDKQGHPLFDADNKPVFQTKDNLGYDENGKKLHVSKEKPPKVVAVSISRGTLTIDGMTGKAALNYEIKDLKYVYFYVPGIGTTVVSTEPFPGAVEQKHAFDDKTLTVTVNEHTLQLSSDKRILGKAPESAFVLVDKNFTVPTKFPVMGYGPIRVAPYAWPGSKDNAELKGGVAEPPPLPENLRPALLLQPCPAGQMRKAAQPVLPGQAAPPRPCIPISQGQAATTSANQSVTLQTNTQSQQ